MTPIDYNDTNEFWTEEERDFYKGLSDEERIAAAILRIVYTCLTLLVAVLLCALFSGCTTTKYVTVPEYHTDTLRQVTVRHDSVMVHDSIHVSEKGDTVRIERWHTQYRDRWRTDTIYQSKRDSIPYPVEVIKEVPAQLTWWQQTRLHLANIVLWLLVVLAVIYVGKKHLARLVQD
jgi:hypothetical protein